MLRSYKRVGAVYKRNRCRAYGMQMLDNISRRSSSRASSADLFFSAATLARLLFALSDRWTRAVIASRSAGKISPVDDP